MIRRIVAAILVLLTPACAAPPPRPPPVVTRVSSELGGLRVHVHQIVTPRESPHDEDYSLPELTHELRRAFVRVLGRAGYTVVLGRHEAHDVTALIGASWDTSQAGIASLELEVDGQVLDHLYGIVPEGTSCEFGSWCMEEGAANLLREMSHSKPLAALAREVARRPVLKVAAPPAAR